MKTVSWKRELIRLIPLLGLAALVLVPDSSSAVVYYAFGIILLAIAMAHVCRKLLFPYLDAKQYFEKAMENPLSAGIVVAAVIYFTGVIVQSAAMLVK